MAVAPLPRTRPHPDPARAADALGARPQPLWAQVYENLKDKIIRLELEPCRQLSEKELTAALAPSKTPIREALIRLADEGLVDIYPQSGTYVAPIRLPVVHDALFTRRSLEGSIVHELASAGQDLPLDELEALIAEQWAATVGQDQKRFYELDEALHRGLCVLAGRERVWRFIQLAKVHLDRVRRLILPDDLGVRALAKEHEDSVEAISGRRPEAARESMQLHISGLLRSLDGVMARYPNYFEPTRR